MIRCVVFDFDGVLVESNAIKYEAYFEALPASIPGLHDAVREIHAAGGYGDRSGLIGKALAAVAGAGHGRSDLEERTELFARRYGELTVAGVAACAEVPGATEALSSLSLRFPLYVNSATPEAVLRELVDRRRWSGFFQQVLGAPSSKLANLEAIVAREAIAPPDLLFVGDSSGDLEAARSIGCRFIGVDSHMNDLSTNGLELIRDLLQLADIIEGPRG